MSRSFPVRLALVPMLATFVAAPVGAQSASIRFTNTDIPAIPLLDSSSVSIDTAGNLLAQCVLDGETCQGITTGAGGDAPVVTLSRTNGTADIVKGASIALSWTVTNSAAVCVTSSTPSVTGWNGGTVAAAGGTASLPLTTEGANALSLKCYNDAGGSELATVAATVVPGDGGGGLPDAIPLCTVDGIAGNELVQPTGFTGHLITWAGLMFGAEFPDGKSHLSPVGSFTLRNILSSGTRGPTMNARYITTPFIAGANANYNLSWLGAQAITAAGYNPPRAASQVFVSISPCAGDLRPRVQFSPDPLLGICRAFAGSASIKYGTTGAAGQCPLVEGQTYFINIAMVNPSDGLTLTETSCAPGEGNRCEANFDGN
jgi:hypothetical protein